MASLLAVHAAYDAFRYLTILQGFTLLVISLHATAMAYIYGWPRRVKFGMTLRWIGRFMMVAFMTAFIYKRLHHPINWYTPVVFTCFTLLNIGGWLTRDLVYDDERKVPL